MILYDSLSALFICMQLHVQNEIQEECRMEERKTVGKLIKNIGFELVGSMLIAISTYNVALHARFPVAGFSGIAMILYRLFGIPMGLSNLIMNIPMAVLCYRMIGSRFLLRTVRCMVISSILLDTVAPLFPVYEGNRMVAAILAGVLEGVGYGLIYIRGSSTGGMDFLIMLVKSWVPHINLGAITFVFAIGVVAVGGLIFRDMDGIVYGMLINFISATTVDRMILGLNSGKLALIVTDRSREVCRIVDQCCGRGSTILDARGGYQGAKKDVVMVAGTNKDIYLVEKTVKREDPESFIIIIESKAVYGEGFHMTQIAEGHER